VYSGVFYAGVRDTPKGSTYFRPKKSGGIEVTSKRDFYFLLAMNVPMFVALGALTLKLVSVKLLPSSVATIICLGLVGLYALQAQQIYRVNRELFQREVPEARRYKFKQVAILDLAYFVSFGSELAVVSMLPLFFLHTFSGLTQVTASLVAASFPFMNLTARPLGGWLSDRFGRRKTMALLIAGLSCGYLVLSQVTGHWPLWLAVTAAMGCSFFVQAAAGSVFAMVPLVQRRMTGQIAGMAGAYGNTGGVCFLTVLSLVDYSTFFAVIAATGAAALVAIRFMDEPRGHMVEVAEDGTVQLLEVA
jgi:NNP family nitrate/nitrite transporter-like MFS transporter